jgi:hypothetical protein
MEQHIVRSVLGPVWSHGGLKYWKLHLHDYAIVAYSYTFRESFKVAFRLHMERYSPDPGLARDERVSTGSSAGARGGHLAARRYEISLVRKIEMISSHMQNRVRIEKLSGERHTYVIPVRAATDLYRKKLRELYPDIYAERDFPGTWLGRLLKR